jgi:ribosomal protein S18 acetylase RimI-like enzyme
MNVHPSIHPSMHARQYHLTVLHSHASSQTIAQSVFEQYRTSSPFTGTCQYIKTCVGSHDVTRILDQLVSIEKKHWTKSQSWGDQFRRLTVQKQNAYVFVLLSSSPTEHDVVAYCVMYAHALHGQLSKLWVREEERNKGCAMFLVSYAIEYIRVAVVKKNREYSIVLFVESENSAAKALYTRKVGFTIEDELLGYYHATSNAYRMRLDL